MMKCLREVNVDNNCVGWYKTKQPTTLLQNDTIDMMQTYCAAAWVI